MTLRELCRVRCSKRMQQLCFIMLRRPTSSTLFPYTTLFRSRPEQDVHRRLKVGASLRLRGQDLRERDRKSTRLNSSHRCISYAVFCLKKKIGPMEQDSAQFDQKLSRVSTSDPRRRNALFYLL